MVMAENARTSFVWDTFMRNPEAQRGMERAGFKPYLPSPAQQTEKVPPQLSKRAREAKSLVSLDQRNAGHLRLHSAHRS